MMDSLNRQRLAVILISALSVIIAISWFGADAGNATGIAAFVVTVANALLGWLAEGSFLVALYRSLRVTFMVITISIFIYAWWLLYKNIDAFNQASIHAFAALASAVLLASSYAIWKFRALRYTEARVSYCKYIVMEVHEVLREQGLSEVQKVESSLRLVLEGLVKVAELSIWHAAINLLSMPAGGIFTAAIYWEARPSQRDFRMRRVFWNQHRTPDGLRAVMEWMAQNHFPVFLNYEKWKDIIRQTKRPVRRGWRKRYFANQTRRQCISVCGWTYDMIKESLLSDDSGRCLAWDQSFMEAEVLANYHKRVKQYMQAKSFIALPIPESLRDPGGVLLVVKNRYHGFDAEQREAMVLLSQLWRRVLEAHS